MAFEVQGRQHYEYSKMFHSKIGLAEIQKKDKVKARICKKNKVFLVPIPYWIKYDGLITYLRKYFREHRNSFPRLPKGFKVNLTEAYSPKMLEEMRELADKRGGKCMSKSYLNAKTPLEWKCSKGHTWETSPTNIQAGSWCPECANVKKVTISDAIELAESREGKFLAKKFIRADNKYKWQCKEGHVWKTTYSSIRSGTWCKMCAVIEKKVIGYKLNIDIMQERARGKNGECLSRRYVNAKTPLRWKCQEGHVWMATPDTIQGGSWCIKCFEKRRGASQRLSIELMQEVAKENGGKCLSKEYTNARTKLKWQCSKKHVWENTPDVIRRGYWCKKCAREKRTEKANK